eukprot:42110-Eustigmatos_ZCMA.PRE.1
MHDVDCRYATAAMAYVSFHGCMIESSKKGMQAADTRTAGCRLQTTVQLFKWESGSTNHSASPLADCTAFPPTA